jgi:hypothetical protein
MEVVAIDIQIEHFVLINLGKPLALQIVRPNRKPRRLIERFLDLPKFIERFFVAKPLCDPS